jgi:hypothetical protein
MTQSWRPTGISLQSISIYGSHQISIAVESLSGQPIGDPPIQTVGGDGRPFLALNIGHIKVYVVGVRMIGFWLLTAALAAVMAIPVGIAPTSPFKGNGLDAALALRAHGRRPVRAAPHQGDSSSLSLESESGPETSFAKIALMPLRLVVRPLNEAVHVVATSPPSLAFLCCLRI